jgi:hypothetical protein
MTAQNEGYKIMPPMDPKYTERSGLEGPFTTLSGKVVYYDPKEGKYYDPDTDMYMTYDEFQNYDKDYSGMKDERDEVGETLSPEDKALVSKMYNKDGTLTDLGKRVMGTKESRTLENLMAKVFGKTVNEFEFNPNAGHRDQMSHPENRGLDADPNKSYSPRPKLRPKNLKAPMTSPRPKARPKDLEMKYAINKAVQQAVGEGDSPHKKGSAKYKAHMAAKHASMAESTSKPEVSVTEMQDALKLKDAPSNEHVVASYVQTMIDESHKTWDDVMEQVEYVLDLVKESDTMKAEDVFNIVKVQHMQNYFDYKMSLKENLDTLRNIVKDKSYQTVKFEDGSMKVDLTTANMFLQVFDAQKPETQEKIQAKIKTKQGFLAMLDLIYSKM